MRCFDCKSTKNLRAIHNTHGILYCFFTVVSTAKVQKIWEQFTTYVFTTKNGILLFRLQKYKKFESNSQQLVRSEPAIVRCFDCKSTKNLRAIHNCVLSLPIPAVVVSTAKVQKIWEQFTTTCCLLPTIRPLFRLQKYKKFESNSQRWRLIQQRCKRCFDCKSTKNLRAIHNTFSIHIR